VLVLGTATQGGGFPLYGDAFAEVVNAQDPTLGVQPRNTKGSGENVPLLEAGKLDIALVAGEFVNAALAKPDTGLRIITAIYATPGMFIVPAASPIRTIADLKGRAVVLGAQASGITVLGRNVLQALGVEVQPIYLEKVVDGPPMLADGRAAAVWGAGVGWPAFIAIAKAGGRFVVPDASEIRTILARNPGLQAVTLPAGSYPGQNAPLPSVGAWSYVLASEALKEETAYRLGRAIHKGEDAFAACLEQARQTTMANTLAAAPRRELIHPGVLRYLREAGIPGAR
jgi:TRAP transporter TAXI family solute receptor